MKPFLKPLTIEEETACLVACQQGDAGAKERLIEHNLRLVAHIVKKYQTSGEEPDDLISIGTIGLIKAVNTYNQEKGRRLGTYAAKCIENAILSQMCLWFRTSLPRAEKSINGVFWHRFPRISTSFAPPRMAM